MKNYVLKISSYLTILFLVSNCASHRTKKEAVLANSSTYSSKKTAASTLFFKDTDAEKHWVDSIYNKISLEEKVGQLFMVRSYSNKDSTHVNEIDKLVREYKIGGVFFMQGGPVRQVRLNNRFQAAAKIPLFIATDAEWGLAMRLDSTYRYPWNMTLGAIKDLKLLEKIGENMAKE